MSESDEGLIVSETRQNAGRLAAVRAAAPPPGGVNRPAATGCAAVTVVFESFNDAARRSQAAADTDGSSACSGTLRTRAATTAATLLIEISYADFRLVEWRLLSNDNRAT
jgi:hypothetical protein